jgi:hypothetical protein
MTGVFVIAVRHEIVCAEENPLQHGSGRAQAPILISTWRETLQR